ncbi:hypothetical protein OEZ60_07250 [Defluviimonas sp. WL0024]|uniref:Flp pilus assembly protein TadG n=1 Tax=Albidovulum salinarum TaxID=2984153 RepID=A0ABT2X1I1_9RHOB|nr:hypothetical protein [Defluviimonas sp. WL0024]MCU9847801.1 hypothetical protein [Defluviimonas sp. WL0024]
MSLISRLRLRGRDFATDTRGSMPVEGMIASVWLIWWLVASVQFFDAFRQKNLNLKATHTIADMVARVQQDDVVDDAYIEGLNKLFGYMTASSEPTWVRLSSVIWDDKDERHEVAWSHASGRTPAQTTGSIHPQTSRIPVMPEGEAVIIVETGMAYEPIFNVGLAAQWLTSFVPTAPRFTSCVKFDPGDGATVPACVYDGDKKIELNGDGNDDGTRDPSIDSDVSG